MRFAPLALSSSAFRRRMREGLGFEVGAEVEVEVEFWNASRDLDF